MNYKGDSTHTERCFCVKCRTDVMVSAPELYTLKSGRFALRGKCPHCGCGTYKMISKSRAESLSKTTAP